MCYKTGQFYLLPTPQIVFSSVNGVFFVRLAMLALAAIYLSPLHVEGGFMNIG